MNQYSPDQRIRAIILTPIRDFGRCRLASHTCAALWPVAGKPVLNRLLADLHSQGVNEAVICAYGNAEPLHEAVGSIDAMQLDFQNERFPAGNAGCIRNAWDGDRQAVFLVLHAATIAPPKVGPLIRMHRDSDAHLTVILGSAPRADGAAGLAPELYICDPDVLDYVPPQGYFDVKEGLIPALVKAGQTVATGALPRYTCAFRDRRTYLYAMGQWLTSSGLAELAAAGLLNPSKDLWVAPAAGVDPQITTHGPVVVLDRARIGPGAVIFGPALIESAAVIGPNTVIDSSIIWSGAVIGPDCHIAASVIGQAAVLPAGAVVRDDVVLRESTAGPRFRRAARTAPKAHRVIQMVAAVANGRRVE